MERDLKTARRKCGSFLNDWIDWYMYSVIKKMVPHGIFALVILNFETFKFKRHALTVICESEVDST